MPDVPAAAGEESRIVLGALLLSFGVIFVAELGDRSQLMAMTFALRHKWWIVLAGITVATTGVHIVSVGVGHFLGAALPTHLIGILGGIAFLAFGLWTLRGDALSDDEARRADKTSAPAFFAVLSAFLLAELGDKTMLATITLAADHNWAGVWIGSTVGMVAADALAIVVGAIAGKHLPENAIRIGAGVLFLFFGVWMILENSVQSLSAVAAVPIALAGTATICAVLWLLRGRLSPLVRREHAIGQLDPASGGGAGAAGVDCSAKGPDAT